MVSRALYNFQAQNYRELSFKKGDLVYIRRQVIWFKQQFFHLSTNHKTVLIWS